jgi:hypothetical protein
MTHLIKITGKISWDGQANGLPPEIFAFLLFTEYDKKLFNDTIEGQVGQFIKYQGMAVQQDQGQIIDIREMPQDRMWVPMKWIVKIIPTIHQLTGELPEADEHGVERLVDGSEPVKQ